MHLGAADAAAKQGVVRGAGSGDRGARHLPHVPGQVHVGDRPALRGAGPPRRARGQGLIDNAAELLDAFLDSFHDETPEVQVELLTAVVKLFLKQPAQGQELVTAVLTMSTEESTNADVRDRGYMYWRLLSSDAKIARSVVLREKPKIDPKLEEMIDDETLQKLLEELGMVSSVYHKPAEEFITPKVGPAPIDEIGDDGNVDLDEESEEEYEDEDGDEDIFEEEEEEEQPKEEENEVNFLFWSVCWKKEG